MSLSTADREIQRDAVTSVYREFASWFADRQRAWRQTGDGRYFDPAVLALILGGHPRVTQVPEDDVRLLALALIDMVAELSAAELARAVA